MSGNSALAAAKRRRAINADTTTNANLNKSQNINSQSNIKAKDSKGVNNAQYQSSSHLMSTPISIVILPNVNGPPA